MVYIIAPVLSGVLLFFSFPWHNLSILAWIGFLPLFLSLRNSKGWAAFLQSWICGMVYFIGLTPWINWHPSISKLASAPFYTYLALYFGFFGLLLNFILKRLKTSFLIAAPLWICFEYLRCHASFLALPWAFIGHTQYLNLPLIQLAACTGVYGVSFVLLLVNGAIADLVYFLLLPRIQSKYEFIIKLSPSDPGGHILRARPVLIQCLLIGLLIVSFHTIGWLTIGNPSNGKKLTVSVIQGNLPDEIKWDPKRRDFILNQYETLTRRELNYRPHLIVWPETATPGFVLTNSYLSNRISAMVREFGGYFLTGSAEFPKYAKAAVVRATKNLNGNSALFYSPQGKLLGQYLKIILVPFGETIPLEGIFTWPEFIVKKNKANFEAPGKEIVLFKLDGIRLGAPICWEILFPDLIRRQVRQGADLIVNISNELWFGKSAFPYQVLAAATFRAVENRVNVVRATNTGISGFVDPYGRILGRVTKGQEDTFVEGTLTRTISVHPSGTFYTRFGDVMVYLCLGFSLFLLLKSCLQPFIKS